MSSEVVRVWLSCVVKRFTDKSNQFGVFAKLMVVKKNYNYCLINSISAAPLASTAAPLLSELRQ